MGAVTSLTAYREKRATQSRHGGYILQYRSIDKQPWSKDPICMLIFQWLLRQAQHEHTTVHFKDQTFELDAGQFVTTQAIIARQSGVLALYQEYIPSKRPESAAKKATLKALKTLVDDGAITTETLGAGKRAVTRFCLVNWDEFQSIPVSNSVSNPVSMQPQSERGLAGSPVSIPVSNPVSQNNTLTKNKNNGSTNVDPCEHSDESSLASPTKKSKYPNCPHQQILTLWKTVMNTDNPHEDLWKPGSVGYRNLTSRWKQCFSVRHRASGEFLYTDLRSGLEWWEKVFMYMRKSEFLMERCKPFSLSWICKAENFTKLLEGAWHDKY